MNFCKKIFLLMILFVTLISAQIKFVGVGGGLGLGSIQGNSPAVSSLAFNINSEFKLWFSEVVSFKFDYMHARQVEYFLPENRENKYYPFLNIYDLKASIHQPLSNIFFLEESAGLVALNDRTFGTTNVWDFGGTFSLVGGIDFRDQDKNGITLGLSFDYGITLNQTTASFSFIKLQTQYYF